MQVKKTQYRDANKILDFIQKNNNFLLSAHINADGDAITSVIATGILLEKLRKKYYMVFHDQNIDKKFNYLKNYDKIYNYSDDLNLDIESAIILDVPGLKRLGDTAKLLPPKEKTIKIDHHPVEDDFALIDMVDKNASSAAQLIYEVIELSGIEIDKDLAAAIYTGIVYDTGRFSFANTTSRDMYIGARMIDCGVEPAEINNRLFFDNSFEALRTIGEGLARMESYLNGDVISIALDYDTMQRNHQGEIEELANYSVAIRGGKVGLFIREVKPGFHKVSFRSKSDVDVNEVAKAFGGGGHTRASGCRIEGSKDKIILKILDEIKKRL